MIERVWRGADLFARTARISLAPFEGLYRLVVNARGQLYDRSLIEVGAGPIPAISVGNLSVGGTGKTPFAAWIAAELSLRGVKPAVVIRGYGGDEVMVHSRLNPGVPVVIDKNRRNGIARAAELGANVAVLDDAFQHRGAAREVDVVLIAAEQWTDSLRMLPAGPWREPLSAVRRASLAVITRKTATDASVNRVAAAVERAAPGVPQAVVRFALGVLRRAETLETEALSLTVLSGRPVAAIAGLADPAPFFRQLSDAGAIVAQFPFPDHHAFSKADIDRVLAHLPAGDSLVVCTLKDAVKLAPIWPATARPLWYVSQTFRVEKGAETIEKLLASLTQTHDSRSTSSA